MDQTEPVKWIVIASPVGPALAMVRLLWEGILQEEDTANPDQAREDTSRVRNRDKVWVWRRTVGEVKA